MHKSRPFGAIDDVLPGSPARPSRALESEEAQIQRRLADAIYEHRLPPGTKLAEAELCGIFAVTRGVVRKILNRLAAEQLVDLFPNRGAFVARPSVDETRDVFELRRILETGVVRRLAAKSRHAWMENVRLQIAAEREANRSGDTPRYIRLAGKFHIDLAAATGNAALEQHMKRVVSQTSLMVALYDVPGTNTCSFHEHLEILNAIEAGDYPMAEQLMEDHLLGCERQLRLSDEPQRVDLAQALGHSPEAPAGGHTAATSDAGALPHIRNKGSTDSNSTRGGNTR